MGKSSLKSSSKKTSRSKSPHNRKQKKISRYSNWSSSSPRSSRLSTSSSLYADSPSINGGDNDDQFDFDTHFRQNSSQSLEPFENTSRAGGGDLGKSQGSSRSSRQRKKKFSLGGGLRESFAFFDVLKTINPLSIFISLVVGTSFISFAEAVRVNFVAPIVDVIIPEDFLNNQLKFTIKGAREVEILNKATNKFEKVTIAPKVIDLSEIINILLKLILTCIICYFLLKTVYSVMKWDNQMFSERNNVMFGF